MKQLKVMTILGTRPEIIRLSETIKLLDDVFDHILVHTGQNWDYTLNEIFFQELGIREPDYYLGCATGNLGQTIGQIIDKSYQIMQEQKPDALLLLGDTNSALSAICAKRLKIPIFHMEAGNRCFDENVPEEINRKMIDHISDVNLAYTEYARRNLLSEGRPKDRTYVTGSPMTEILKKHSNDIANSNILEKLVLSKGEYFVVSAHREENIDIEPNFYSLMDGINTIATVYQIPVIYSVHPRSAKLIEARGFTFHPLVQQMKPLGFYDYNKLQMNARCVLSDSGTLAEEAAILNFHAVLIRTSTERPESFETGNLVIGGIEQNGMLQAIKVSTNQKMERRLPYDYTDRNVSSKVVQLIQSYVPIINEMVWRKPRGKI